MFCTSQHPLTPYLVRSRSYRCISACNTHTILYAVSVSHASWLPASGLLYSHPRIPGLPFTHPQGAHVSGQVLGPTSVGLRS
jgi:hypothetical protein